MAKLFSPIEIKGITLKNRIVMSPMCMYSVENKDGFITPFHMTHYIARAVGQVGLIMQEATAVLPEGRISENDVGIWDDQHVAKLKDLNEQIHTYGSKTAIQLAHAGRKANVTENIYAPSPIHLSDQQKQPLEMTQKDIDRTIQAFKDGAKRAKDAGFDIIEIHAAHGYLINQFLSPLINKRTDEYGGSLENRFRFLKEIIHAIKTIWSGPLFARISTDEYHPDGNQFEDILFFVSKMKELGIDLIDCSSGGVAPADIHTYPGYQVKRCNLIKSSIHIKTGAVGLITTGIQAEEILQNDRADLVFIGRALLNNPYWTKQAADELKYTITPPKQYQRGWYY